MIELAGHVVLVTGGGRGLGRAYSDLFAACGATVIVHDAGVAPDGSGFDPSMADAAADAINLSGGAAEAAYDNLGTCAGCRSLAVRVVERHGRVDALVHSAGLVLRKPLDQITSDLWSRSLSVNLEAAFWLCQELVPHMRRNRYGRIVLTTSGYGLRPADEVDDLVAYCVAKGGQFGLMNGLAFAAADNVLVNCVSPVAATRVYSRAVAADELSPQQVAPGVVYLASPACEMTGIVLRAGGGRFSTGAFDRVAAVDFGLTPATPEMVASRWRQIAHGG
jgi:NAD(P)-dependent dehydrogenase (short-subunit alcohol dehydrogenase family)